MTHRQSHELAVVSSLPIPSASSVLRCMTMKSSFPLLSSSCFLFHRPCETRLCLLHEAGMQHFHSHIPIPIPSPPYSAFLTIGFRHHVLNFAFAFAPSLFLLSKGRGDRGYSGRADDDHPDDSFRFHIETEHIL